MTEGEEWMMRETAKEEASPGSRRRQGFLDARLRPGPFTRSRRRLPNNSEVSEWKKQNVKNNLARCVSSRVLHLVRREDYIKPPSSSDIYLIKEDETEQPRQ